MRKLSELFARKNFSSVESVPILLVGRNDQNGNSGNHETATGDEGFSEAGARIGEENEELRNLISEAGRKVGELDEIKQAFGRIVDPINKTLRALEQEKSRSLSLSGTLGEHRTALEALRGDFTRVEKKALSLEKDNERLKEEIEIAQHTMRGFESNRIEITNEISVARAEVGDLQQRLAAENAQRVSLSDDNRTLGEHAKAADKRITQLEAEIVTTQQKLALSEDERRSLQTALDHTVGEVAQLSRQLSESSNALTAAQARVTQLETMFAEADGERHRLIMALDEAKERHRSESSTHGMRFDALQSRAATAEKLLLEARQNLMTRAEEVRAFDRKAVEAAIARNAIEKKLSQMEVLQHSQDRQIKDLEQSRTALVERSTALQKNLKTRETALARAEEKVQALTERVARLETDVQESQALAEKRKEELNALLQGERMERAVAEGALEAARRDNARLQREAAALQASLRRGSLGEDAPLVPRTKRAKGPGKSPLEPIVKA